MITTERLILRPFTESDAADLLEYLHEPTVHCFFDMKISSMDEAKEKAIKRMKTDCYFAIELKDTGKVIGEVFVHPDGEGMEEEHSEDIYFNDTYSPCCLADGDFQNIIATRYPCDDPRIVCHEHGVGIVIATVEPLLNVALDGVHANNIGREIEVPQKVIAMHVLCEVEIAHGDVRASGAEHGVAVSESHGADLPIVK